MNYLWKELYGTGTKGNTSIEYDGNQNKPTATTASPSSHLLSLYLQWVNQWHKESSKVVQLEHSDHPTSPKLFKNLLVESRPYDKSCTNAAKCNLCRNSPSTPSTHCSQKDVVYSIKCELCGKDKGIYIGETSRPLALRFQEHYRAAANPTAKSYKNMAFSKHYNACHKGEKPGITASILKKTNGSLERKVTEALLINKLKPDLNGQVNIVDFII